jgi:maltooligosyltrehalose trehalohydrolase
VDLQREQCTYQYGAIPLDEGKVRFRLWAPGLSQVWLELQGDGAGPQRSMAMQAGDDGFHELTCACPIGARYKYRLDNGLLVPDPASRLQDGDVHDASIVVDDGAYIWSNEDWQGRPWTETVIYEIHAGLAGGFRGVLERLADLEELGVTAIELMPIADFPGARNWGYDGVLPYAPDCSYGSPNDLKMLIDTAHSMGMQVLLDVVYNHFGPDGNFLSAYAPEFFRDDIQTPWGPAIDFRQPAVRAFFAESALYWLREYRFDGLRLDAVHAIAGKEWLPELAAFLRGCLGTERHLHLILENDDNAVHLLREGYDAQWNDDAHHVLHTILTGETQGYYAAYTQDPTRDLARFLAEGFVFQGQPSSWRQGEPRGEPSGSLPPTSFIFFLQNHDQTGNRAYGERLTALCQRNEAALRAAITLQILTPHIPMLFVGEEYGSLSPFQYFTSFRQPELARAVREGRRSEFAAFKEFSDPQARASIPDPNDPGTWERSKALPAYPEELCKSWRALYKSLLDVRRHFITPGLSGARSVSAEVLGQYSVKACWRLGNGSLLRLYCNLSSQAAIVPSPPSRNEIILYVSGPAADDALRQGRLPATSAIATLEAPKRERDSVAMKEAIT